MDDEIERLKLGAMPADMQSWNIEDLQAYIDAMKAEIVRVEALIAQKIECSRRQRHYLVGHHLNNLRPCRGRYASPLWRHGNASTMQADKAAPPVH